VFSSLVVVGIFDRADSLESVNLTLRVCFGENSKLSVSRQKEGK